MKISMWMIFDAISHAVQHYELSDVAAECRISGVLPYLPDQPFSDDHIYVISAEDASKTYTHKSTFLVIYGAGVNESLKLNCQYIILHPEISLTEAFSLLLSTFEKYNSWLEKLNHELTEVPDLMRICSIGYEQLQNPILLFDPNHVLLASADIDSSNFLEKRNGSTLVLSDNAFKTIVNRPEYKDYLEIGRVSSMENPLGGNTLYTNILCRQHEYRLCVNDTNRGFRPGDLQLCKILSDTLQKAMEMDHSRETAAKAELCELFINILEQRSIDPQVYDNILSTWNWPKSGHYICLCIEKTNLKLKFVSNDRYICSKTEELLSDACAFMLNGQLICIVHLSEEFGAKSIPQRLESFLRDNIFIVGISDEFYELNEAACYYREAYIALRSGRSENPSVLFHSFSDYSFYNLMLHGLDSLPPICYCDNNIRRLASLKDSRVDYCETLRTYIENDRNLLRTAELLHIHRTTLFYRLNRIREELSIDWEDPDTRLRIWLSFKLLDLENKIRE